MKIIASDAMIRHKMALHTLMIISSAWARRRGLAALDFYCGALTILQGAICTVSYVIWCILYFVEVSPPAVDPKYGP